MIEKSQKETYLPGLNGIRAIACLLVLIAHSNKAISSILGTEPLSFLGNGLAGVTIFFVLSGFLITYRLLLESDSGEINIRYFYTRRIFRIFPLYYFYLLLTVIITLIARPALLEVDVLPYYVFFCPNIPWILSIGLPNLHHYWSLGVEEQFYLFWPFLFKFGFKRILGISVALFFIFFLIKVYLNSLENDEQIRSFIYAMGFPYILIGCIGAILFMWHRILIEALFNSKACQYVVWFLLTLTIYLGSTKNFFHQEIISMLTMIIIYGQIYTSNRVINLAHPMLSFLGNISFGIYVYHPLLITLTKNLLGKSFHLLGNTFYIVVFYLIIFLATITIAYLSYQYLEKRFLNLKGAYYTVH